MEKAYILVKCNTECDKILDLYYQSFLEMSTEEKTLFNKSYIVRVINCTLMNEFCVNNFDLMNAKKGMIRFVMPTYYQKIGRDYYYLSSPLNPRNFRFKALKLLEKDVFIYKNSTYKDLL